MSDSSSTTNQWLRKATERLKDAGVATARLDALVLLEDATGRDRSWLLAHPEEALSKKVLKLVDAQVERRAKHEPLAYIRGKTEFYGREFLVNNHTLEPRPETEDMIDLLKSLDLGDAHVRVADVGTGSGAIGLTAALEIPHIELCLADIDETCLDTARTNAERLGVEASFHKGNLLEPLLPFRPLPPILLCNLPYVPDGHTINEAAMLEPRHAIFGGVDGLDLYRQLFEQLVAPPRKPPFILTESLPFQHNALVDIANGADYELVRMAGFIQLFKLF